MYRTLAATALTQGWPSSSSLVKTSNCCCTTPSIAAAPVNVSIVLHFESYVSQQQLVSTLPVQQMNIHMLISSSGSIAAEMVANQGGTRKKKEGKLKKENEKNKPNETVNDREKKLTMSEGEGEEGKS